MAATPSPAAATTSRATSTAQIVKVTFNVYEEAAAPTASVALDPATPGWAARTRARSRSSSAPTDTGRQPVAADGRHRLREYRVILNGVAGAWTRNSNPGLVNPFLSNSVTATHRATT